MSFNKEITFIKQVERHCKLDAYQQVLAWARGRTKEQIIWFLNEKIEGHKQFLETLPFEYCYAGQTLIPKQVYTVTVSDVPQPPTTAVTEGE